MNMRMKEAASLRPAAENVDHQTGYNSPRTQSTANLAQAADVLYLLAFWPLSATTRLCLLALLDRRLRRAYGEVV